MGDLIADGSTTTNMDNTVQEYNIGGAELDKPNDGNGETWYDFPDSPIYLQYYKTIPELNRSIAAFTTYVTGKGVTTDARTKVLLERLTGWGEDSFQSIMRNLVISKKIFGDAFAEIIKDDSGRIINIKPLYTGDMRVVVDKKGIIVRYEQRTSSDNNDNIKFKTQDILHLSNDRIGNEIHGTSVIEACKWVIDARNEAMADERKIKHRDLAMGVLEVDSDDSAQIAKITAQYQNAVDKGEVLVLPKDLADIKDNNVTPKDRLEWIRYLEGFFYQAVGIPKVIANSADFTEAGSKVGYLTFEPVYTAEQTELEMDLWNQLAIRVKFKRPPSLHGVVSEDEQKNTGQVGIQPNEVQAQAGRVE
mgnify:CR=1 FL=1